MSGAGARTSSPAPLGGLSARRGEFSLGQIEQIQRARLLAAMAQVADEQGVGNLTVAGIVTCAGVSRRTFYELFRDCEDCLQAALEEAVGRASARVLPVYKAEQGTWGARIRAGLVALLQFFDEQPHAARLLVVQWLAAGPRALESRQRLLARLASAVDEGRDVRPSVGAAVPELMAEGVVGAVHSLLHARLLSCRPGVRLVGFANQLMAVIVQPYLGPAAARKELEQPLPDAVVEENRDRAPEDLFKGLNMRLTYRTMRVLAAVAANPGGSNRVISRAAGIGDQGQISKLLMRLSKLGLLEKKDAQGKGEANAWSLSVRGAQVERLLRG
jgi:AcrR family transcriptional regulator/DNA-binding MarR family transcriptional regulator